MCTSHDHGLPGIESQGQSGRCDLDPGSRVLCFLCLEMKLRGTTGEIDDVTALLQLGDGMTTATTDWLNTSAAEGNVTGYDERTARTLGYEAVIRVVVPVIFTMIAVLGFVGNLSVIIVVVANPQMRSTTNTLIRNNI